MAMTAIEIISNLKIYQDLLNEICQHEIDYAEKTEGFIRLKKKVKSEYSFITLELQLITEGNVEGHLYCKITFGLKDSVPALKDIYIEDKTRLSDLEKKINSQLSVHNYQWQDSPEPSAYYEKDILNYLTIANTIAGTAVNCAHGDHYYPGNFSKITVTDTFIKLSQVNHMNSRSLDHKTDYSLRDLEFTIPLTSVAFETSYGDTKIGDMVIHFSDRSSSNNRKCGDAVSEKIESERARYTEINH